MPADRVSRSCCLVRVGRSSLSPTGTSRDTSNVGDRVRNYGSGVEESRILTDWSPVDYKA